MVEKEIVKYDNRQMNTLEIQARYKYEIDI